MQGINSKEHRILLNAFHKFEHLSTIHQNKIEEVEDARTRKAMEELDALYDKFQLLYTELEQCTKAYEIKKKSTRSIISSCLRKIQVQNKFSNG